MHVGASLGGTGEGCWPFSILAAALHHLIHSQRFRSFDIGERDRNQLMSSAPSELSSRTTCESAQLTGSSAPAVTVSSLEAELRPLLE